jgi:hypothetical protein
MDDPASIFEPAPDSSDDELISISEEDLNESMALAMRAEGIQAEVIDSVLATVNDAIANNVF